VHVDDATIGHCIAKLRLISLTTSAVQVLNMTETVPGAPAPSVSLLHLQAI
jgi:hypothetical protein